MREESRLRVFANWVLRRIFWAKRDGETEKWRKLKIVGLNDLYCSPTTVRVIKLMKIRWDGYVACMGEMRTEYRVLKKKPKGKRIPGRPTYKRKNNIKMDFEKVDPTMQISLIRIRIQHVSKTSHPVECGDTTDWLTMCLFNNTVT